MQGSTQIIDWADAAATTNLQSLTPQTAGEECAALEARLDHVVGVHVRRYYYSEALIEQPQTVKPIFTENLGVVQKNNRRRDVGSGAQGGQAHGPWS